MSSKTSTFVLEVIAENSKKGDIPGVQSAQVRSQCEGLKLKPSSSDWALTQGAQSLMPLVTSLLRINSN